MLLIIKFILEGSVRRLPRAPSAEARLPYPHYMLSAIDRAAAARLTDVVDVLAGQEAIAAPYHVQIIGDELRRNVFAMLPKDGADAALGPLHAAGRASWPAFSALRAGYASPEGLAALQMALKIIEEYAPANEAGAAAEEMAAPEAAAAGAAGAAAKQAADLLARLLNAPPADFKDWAPLAQRTCEAMRELPLVIYGAGGGGGGGVADSGEDAAAADGGEDAAAADGGEDAAAAGGGLDLRKDAHPVLSPVWLSGMTPDAVLVHVLGPRSRLKTHYMLAGAPAAQCDLLHLGADVFVWPLADEEAPVSEAASGGSVDAAAKAAAAAPPPEAAGGRAAGAAAAAAALEPAPAVAGSAAAAMAQEPLARRYVVASLATLAVHCHLAHAYRGFTSVSRDSLLAAGAAVEVRGAAALAREVLALAAPTRAQLDLAHCNTLTQGAVRAAFVAASCLVGVDVAGAGVFNGLGVTFHDDETLDAWVALHEKRLEERKGAAAAQQWRDLVKALVAAGTLELWQLPVAFANARFRLRAAGVEVANGCGKAAEAARWEETVVKLFRYAGKRNVDKGEELVELFEAYRAAVALEVKAAIEEGKELQRGATKGNAGVLPQRDNLRDETRVFAWIEWLRAHYPAVGDAALAVFSCEGVRQVTHWLAKEGVASLLTAAWVNAVSRKVPAARGIVSLRGVKALGTPDPLPSGKRACAGRTGGNGGGSGGGGVGVRKRKGKGGGGASSGSGGGGGNTRKRKGGGGGASSGGGGAPKRKR